MMAFTEAAFLKTRFEFLIVCWMSLAPWACIGGHTVENLVLVFYGLANWSYRPRPDSA